MMRHRRRKCCHCQHLYEPDPRNRWHQRYCSALPCQQASRLSSQRRWTRSAQGRGYFRRPKHAQRVRAWREAHPGYWRKPRQDPARLQDVSLPQPVVPPRDEPVLNVSDLVAAAIFPVAAPSTAVVCEAPKALPLQDILSAQLALLLGVIAQLSGALPEDIAPHLRRVFLLGRQVQGLGREETHGRGQTGAVPGAAAQDTGAVQLARPSAGAG